MAIVYNTASILSFLELPKAAYAITSLCLLHRTYGIFLLYTLFQDGFTVKLFAEVAILLFTDAPSERLGFFSPPYPHWHYAPGLWFILAVRAGTHGFTL